MARRFTGLLAASVFSAVMLSAAACTSTGGASNGASTPSASLTPAQVMPLFMQCLADHDVTIYDRAEGDVSVVSLGTEGGWYKNGHIVVARLETVGDALEGFYPISPDFKPEQMIADWVDNAALHRTWPKVCAPLP